MSQITISHLSFTYDGDYTPVFQDLDLRLDTGWKLGLVGRNGRGKTTLLKLLAGEAEGRGTISRPVPCLRWPRPVSDPMRPVRALLLEETPPEEAWRLDWELSKVGLEGEVPGPALRRPQRRGADPGLAGRPLSPGGRLPHARRAHQPPGRPGPGPGGRLPPGAGPGLPPGLPRPGLSGPLHRPHPGPEPHRPGAHPGELLRVVGGEGGPGPGGAGPEREAEGGDPPAGAGRPGAPPPGRTRWSAANTAARTLASRWTGALWATGPPS